MPGIDLEPSRKPLRARFPQGLTRKQSSISLGLIRGDELNLSSIG